MQTNGERLGHFRVSLWLLVAFQESSLQGIERKCFSLCLCHWGYQPNTLYVVSSRKAQCSSISSLSSQQGLRIIRIDVTRPERSGHSTQQLRSFVNDKCPPFLVLLMRLNPRKGHFTWELSIMSSPQGTALYWLYWIMWHNIDLCRGTCYLSRTVLVIFISEFKHPSYFISAPSLSEMNDSGCLRHYISCRYVFSTTVLSSPQTLAGSWWSQTQWSGVENSLSLTMWTLTMLLLSGKQTPIHTHIFTHTHKYWDLYKLSCCRK